ncbi:PREDICTED: G-type lectin S-receptor-like serine/threonine-protein kinase SD1-13 [Prunus mume]|uniref:Receptor-like serine/threonine-protein kinase n=1 Tax=Prunus mume TaxID=102107 RepID=A0ABM0NLJ7_PRUMU|nr:PREDICTED: G-type lectin S-receptor-like serine/threonine-protein kinase SD1-13 [Prunus mume]
MARCSLTLTVFIMFSILMWSTSTCGASGTDTLKPGETLDYSSLLVSANGKFTLGFYVSDHNNSKYSRYLGIWCKQNYMNYPWIANRDKPIPYPFVAVLALEKTNSTLKITLNNGTGSPIQLYTAPKASTNINTSNVVATLLDSGNFVLQEVNSESLYGSTVKRVLWQSFDYPTDILLPGMKVGIDHRNGHIWSLISWLTEYSGEPRPFTLDWDPSARQLKIRRRGVVYWTSGAFINNNRFKFILPDDESNLRYNFTIVSNVNEDYFTFASANAASEWMLTTTGRLIDLDGGVDVAQSGNCHGQNSDGGCQRWDCTRIHVRFDPRSGEFHQISKSDLDSIISTDPDASLSSSDCMGTCMSSCDCIGFSSLFDNETGCKFWSGNWKFVEDYLPDNTTRVFVQTTEATRSGTVIENALLDLTDTNGNGLQNDGLMEHDLRVFSYAFVMAATDNFSTENKLGEGGFGPVYKGTLESGQEIAVKTLSRCSGQGTFEFKNELILISELQHTNLVRLFGFCIHNEERMLIYENMPNKSLDYLLFGTDPTRGLLLDWKTRFGIIEGIAQGLLYLHKYSRLRVIHRDLKASNILLDENMNPKISDFGISRAFVHNEMEANTDRIVGTLGYMSPEYAMEGVFSPKSDVYSFGVLMLEIICGRKNSSFYHDDRVISIVGYAWELWKEGAGLELMDPTLGESCVRDQLLRCVHVSLLCVEENADDQPTMSDVISMLTNEGVPLPIPTKPAFFTKRRVIGRGGLGGNDLELISINGLSNSDLEGR